MQEQRGHEHRAHGLVTGQGGERYRRVFENSPVSIGEEAFSRVKTILDRLRHEGVTDLDSYLTRHPETDHEGKIVGVLSVGRDTTDRKKAEDALLELNGELELRVRKRTAELEKKNAELERMNKLFVGRELRMVELKMRVRELEKGQS